jgi:hypothetical protein
MRVFLRLISAVMLVASLGCSPSSSVAPPPGWARVANSRFDFFVPPSITNGWGWGLLDTNALYGAFEDASMHLTFEYGVSHEGYSGFTKAPHFRSYQEHISGKTVKIFEFYYEPFVIISGPHQGTPAGVTTIH